MKVRFVVPIRHPDGVANKAMQLAQIAETIASLGAQTSGQWTATIVANDTQALPPLPDRVRVQHVDFPMPMDPSGARSREEVYEIARVDKGRRIAAGLGDVQPEDLIMVVDDDDLVHRDLVHYVTSQTQRCGWIINHGYFWVSGSRLMHLTKEFRSRCGTSLLVPPDYYAYFAGGLPEADALRELGSHKLIFNRIPRKAPAWDYIPFPAGIYRLQSSGFSRSQHQVQAATDGAEGRGAGLAARLASIGRIRYVGKDARRAFFGVA